MGSLIISQINERSEHDITADILCNNDFRARLIQ